MSKGTRKAPANNRDTAETEADSLISLRAGPVFTGIPGVKGEKFLSFANHTTYGFPVIGAEGLSMHSLTSVEDQVLTAISELNKGSPFRRGDRVEIVLGKEGTQPPANTSITDSSRDSSWGESALRVRREYPSIDLTPIHPLADVTSSSGSTIPDDFKGSKRFLRSYRRAWRDYSQALDDSSEGSVDSAESSKPVSRYAELIPEDSQCESKDMFKSVDALVTAGVIKEVCEDESDEELDISMEPEPLVPLKTQQKVQMPTLCPIPAKELHDSMSDLMLNEDSLRACLMLEPPSGFSPVYRKAVVCEDRRHRRTMSDSRTSLKSLTILQAYPCSGYRCSLTLEFSSGTHSSKAIIDNSKEGRKLPSMLLSPKIVRWGLSSPIAWLSCGFEHVVIVTVECEVFSWGYGGAGTLGHGDTRSYAEPERVKTLSGKGVSYVECGGYHTAALSEAGRLWMWGRGDVNQIGIDPGRLTVDEFGCYAPFPIEIDDLKSKRRIIKGVACGEAHSLVLTSEGEVYACGWAEDGQLGLPPSLLTDGTMTPRLCQIPALTHVIKVAAGALFSAALTSTGAVLTWGNGEQGQLGLGSRLLRTEKPTTVESLEQDQVVDLVCGENSVVCVSAAGRAYGWGSGVAGAFESGQFAAGSALVCYVPRELAEVRTPHLFRVVHHAAVKQQAKSDFIISLQEELMRLEVEDE